MRKTFLSALCIVAATLACSTAQADLITLDFTVSGTAAGDAGLFAGTQASYVQTFSDAGRSADVTVTTAGTDLGAIAVGLGANGGTQGGRVGLSEDLTLTFSNFMGTNFDGSAFDASNIQFQGFIAPTLATSGVFSVESGDEFLVNGIALTGTDTGTGTPASLAYTGGDTVVYAYQNAASLVSLNGSDALVLDLTTDVGSGYRLSGIALEVSNPSAVPEPSSLAFLALGVLGLATRRRK